MTNPRVAIDIVSNDRSSRGVQSAERRFGAIPKRADAANRRMIQDGDRAISRSSGGMLRTLGVVERAGARVFGGRSITGGLADRLGGLSEAASATGSGLREAAAAGGVFEGAAAAAGVAIGATVGILAAAAYGAFKLADGWAKGAAAIGRTAETIGVSTKTLQEFSAAAERAGVDKDKAVGSLGGLSQTLNDARYGRNIDAASVLKRLGIETKLGADGDVDVGAMLPSIADAISRQTPANRRKVAQMLGIGLDTLPALTGGGAGLSRDMADAPDHTAFLGDDQIATGTRIARKSAMFGQLKDRAVSAAGAAAASAAEPGYDAAIKAGTALSDGTASLGGIIRSTFAPAADKIAAGGRAIERAAVGLTNDVIGMFQRVAGRHGQRASVMLAQYGVESGYGRHMPAGSNNPFGIKARPGEPFVMARTREEDRFGRSYYTMAKFRKFGSLEEAADARARLLDGRRYARVKSAGSADDAADALYASGYATDHAYAPKLKREIHGHGLDRYDGQQRVQLDVLVTDQRVKAIARGPRGTRPAVSMANLGGK